MSDDPCTCKPGDGSVDCPRLDECFVRWAEEQRLVGRPQTTADAIRNVGDRLGEARRAMADDLAGRPWAGVLSAALVPGMGAAIRAASLREAERLKWEALGIVVDDGGTPLCGCTATVECALCATRFGSGIRGHRASAPLIIDDPLTEALRAGSVASACRSHEPGHYERWNAEAGEWESYDPVLEAIERGTYDDLLTDAELGLEHEPLDLPHLIRLVAGPLIFLGGVLIGWRLRAARHG